MLVAIYALVVWWSACGRIVRLSSAFFVVFYANTEIGGLFLKADSFYRNGCFLSVCSDPHAPNRTICFLSRHLSLLPILRKEC